MPVIIFEIAEEEPAPTLHQLNEELWAALGEGLVLWSTFQGTPRWLMIEVAAPLSPAQHELLQGVLAAHVPHG